MNELDSLREKIDGIDACIAGLLQERLALAKEIAKIKKARGLEIFQKGREAEVLKNIANKVSAEEYRGYILEIYETILKTSKLSQQEQP